MQRNSEIIKAARFNAMIGFSVFPLHGIALNGQCTCGCTGNSRGKHPIDRGWQVLATKDLTSLDNMFLNDNVNLGIKTGRDSNCWVLDIDGPEGEVDLAAMEEKHGKIAATLTAKTSRGRHLYFKHPKFDVPNRVRLSNKIDIRGDGGLVVSPPSKHYSGVKYEWLNPLEEIIDAPQWLLDLIMKPKHEVAPIEASNNISKFQGISGYDKRSNEEIAEMLSYLDPDMGYMEWIGIGMALHDEGYPLSLWDDWSGKGAKYKQGECSRKWKSFRGGGGIGLGTLVQKAQEGGYLRSHMVIEKPGFSDALETPEKPEINTEKKPAVKTNRKPFYDMFDGVIGDTINEILNIAEKPLPELAAFNTIAALGAIFGRRYAGPQNARTNIYMVGIAPTGSGKEHSRQFIKTLMFKAGLDMFIGPDRFISGAGLMTSLSKRPSQIGHPDEFGMMLKEMSNKMQPHMGSCGRIITELFSSSRGIFKGGQYAAKDEDPIDINYPNLCLFCTTTMGKYSEAMTTDVIGSGELNRFLVIAPKNPHPERIFQGNAFPEPSAELIKKWEQFRPTLGMNDNEDRTKTRIVKNPETERINAIKLFMDKKVEAGSLTAPLWARYAEYVVKIAMIQAIARDIFEPEINRTDIDAAEALVSASLEFMEDMAESHVFDSEEAKIKQRIFALVKTEVEISTSNILRKFRDLNSKQVRDALINLNCAGRIIKFEKPSAGRHSENWKINED